MKLYIFLFISFLLGSINPYIGMFSSIFISIQILILFCFITNGKTRIQIAEYAGGLQYSKQKDFYYKHGKNLLNMSCVIAVVLFLLTVFICGIIWFISIYEYSGSKVLMPIDFFSLKYNYATSFILLILCLIFNLLGTMCVFQDRKKILENTDVSNMLEFSDFNDITFKISKTTICSLLISILLCFIDLNSLWCVAVINLFFLLTIFIPKLIIKLYIKNINSNNFLSVQSKYGLIKFCKKQTHNNILIMSCWLITICAIFTEIFMISINTSLFNIITNSWSGLLYVCTIIFEVLVALFLSRDIRNINAHSNKKVINN